jgi:hypothetical protein
MPESNVTKNTASSAGADRKLFSEGSAKLHIPALIAALGERLDAILTESGARIVGGTGSVAAPQNHVYGHYDVRTIRSRDFSTTSGLALPNVIVVERGSDGQGRIGP